MKLKFGSWKWTLLEIDVHSENVCIEEDVLAPFLKFFKGSSDSVVEEEEVGGVLEGSKERGDESEEAKKVCAEYPEPKPGHFVVGVVVIDVCSVIQLVS